MTYQTWPLAVGYQDFFQRNTLEKIQEKLKRVNVVVISGPSGVGKTEIARQLLKKYLRDDEDLVHGIFHSDSVNSLIAELRDFATLKGLRMDSLHGRNLENIFNQLFVTLSDYFGEKQKFLLFDDAELSTSVLRHIDAEILSPLASFTDQESMGGRWTIVVTTKGGPREWQQPYVHVKTDNFVNVQGFSDDEMVDFLFRSERARTLTDDDMDMIREKFGRRPLMLKALRKEIEMDLSVSATDIMRNFARKIDQVRGEDKHCAALQVSLQRVVSQSIYTSEYKQLFIMLTMLNETNLTAELLVSCAEVILETAIHDDRKAMQDLHIRAGKLQRSFVADLVQQPLCDRPVEFYGTVLIRVHKLVKQSMNVFRQPLDAHRDADIARKTLLALTRVMPRDGRSHQSHFIHGYLYNHAVSLCKEIESLQEWGAISRTRTPSTLLLLSCLEMSMGYCQLSMRDPLISGAVHLNNALDIFSKLMTERNYNELGAWVPDEDFDVQKAGTLYEECVSMKSPLYNDAFFQKMATNAPMFKRLSKRDLHVALEAMPLDIDKYVANDHITYLRYLEMANGKRALTGLAMHDFYAAELLGDIFAVSAKSLSFRTDVDMSAQCLGYAKAANHIYRRIKSDFNVLLLGQVITEREILKLQMNSPQLTVEKADKLVEAWEELLFIKQRTFEHGLIRAELGYDGYHKFLCEEGIVLTLGRKCAIAYSDAEFDRVSRRFLELVESIKEAREKTHMNFLTTAKCFRNFADFQFRCHKLRDAIRSIIDGFIYLNKFLLATLGRTPFPEQDPKCGKSKPFYHDLAVYFQAYDSSHSDGGLLQHDGIDQDRIEYVKKFVDHWKKNDCAVNDHLKLMEKVLDASDMDLSNPYGYQAMPVQASE